MQFTPNYADLFRSRPLRFVLPLKTKIGKNWQNNETNLVTLPNTKAFAHYINDDDVIQSFPELLCNIGCETPRINYAEYIGRKYKYFYAICCDVDAEYPGLIIKVDVEDKSNQVWREVNCYPSEPIFVPSPNAIVSIWGLILKS